MDLDLTEEQRMVQEMVASFVRREIQPVAHQMDRDGVYPLHLVQRLGEMGLMGMLVPATYGGAGLDFLAYVIAIEEISRAWASLSVMMSVQNSLVCGPLLRFGNDGQKRDYLNSLARGEKLGCYALTEPGAGSDAGSIQTRAERVGDDYVLNGSKIFITSGSRADVAIVYAVTDAAKGKKGISAFIVDTSTPGFAVSGVEDKLGLRSSDTARLTFDDCRIPAANRLGQEGEGFRIALETLDGGRLGIAAQALGIARGCLENALAYAQERRQFGRRLADFQAVQWMLADMSTEIEAARLLTWRAAWLAEQQRSITEPSSMAKLFASESCNRIAYKALQIFGGYGYVKDSEVERLYRDARITTLYEGTSEIQRLVIARSLLHGKEISDEPD